MAKLSHIIHINKDFIEFSCFRKLSAETAVFVYFAWQMKRMDPSSAVLMVG